MKKLTIAAIAASIRRSGIEAAAVILNTAFVKEVIEALKFSTFDLALSIKSDSFLIAKPLANNPVKKFKALGNTLTIISHIDIINSNI